VLDKQQSLENREFAVSLLHIKNNKVNSSYYKFHHDIKSAIYTYPTNIILSKQLKRIRH